MTMREENLHAGGKWETMNFLGVALYKYVHALYTLHVYIAQIII